jgi:hypothetical protein
VLLAIVGRLNAQTEMLLLIKNRGKIVTLGRSFLVLASEHEGSQNSP